jgi:hypothetical protein
MPDGRRFQVASLCAAWLLGASAAAAQEPGLTIDRPRVEIAAGFALVDFADVNVRPTCIELRLPCGTGKTFGDYGGLVSGTVRMSDVVSLVGEAGLYANMWQPGDSPYATANQVRAALAGVRLSSPIFQPAHRDPQRLRLFAQLLYGVETSDAVPGGRALQPGAGVDFTTRYPVRIRVEADYAVVEHRVRDLSAGRILVALVAPIG